MNSSFITDEKHKTVIPKGGSQITAFSPNGNFRTKKKSAKDLLNASFDEEALGKHPKAVYLNGSAKFEPGKETRDETKQKPVWIGESENVKVEGGWHCFGRVILTRNGSLTQKETKSRSDKQEQMIEIYRLL